MNIIFWNWKVYGSIKIIIETNVFHHITNMLSPTGWQQGLTHHITCNFRQTRNATTNQNSNTINLSMHVISSDSTIIYAQCMTQNLHTANKLLHLVNLTSSCNVNMNDELEFVDYSITVENIMTTGNTINQWKCVFPWYFPSLPCECSGPCLR
jgi:hypothetical protein